MLDTMDWRLVPVTTMNALKGLSTDYDLSVVDRGLKCTEAGI